MCNKEVHLLVIRISVFHMCSQFWSITIPLPNVIFMSFYPNT